MIRAAFLCLLLALACLWWNPVQAKTLSNIAYGLNKMQALDVYMPENLGANRPVIIMVHGGGWKHGDKTNAHVITNKTAHFIPNGYVFVSVNYRMLPEADVGKQAEDVAASVAYVQQHAAEWGGDPNHIVLMGHSAGGHLAALVTASAARQTMAGMKPVQATIVLDSAAYNLPAMMRLPHLPLYDEAFGTATAEQLQHWSPVHQLSGVTPPMLLVCSTQRFISCKWAERFAARANELGGKARMLTQDMSHMEINDLLGKDTAYTAAVDEFLSGLH